MAQEKFSNEKNLVKFDDQYEALQQASALIIATEWSQFAEADLNAIKKRLVEPVIFDGRNIFNPSDALAAGINYFSIGRPH